MTLGNGMQLEIKLKKVHDPLYAYKRLGGEPLILLTSETSCQEDLISLSMFHQWVHQVAS
jgi:hypothetical protein